MMKKYIGEMIVIGLVGLLPVIGFASSCPLGESIRIEKQQPKPLHFFDDGGPPLLSSLSYAVVAPAGWRLHYFYNKVTEGSKLKLYAAEIILDNKESDIHKAINNECAYCWYINDKKEIIVLGGGPVQESGEFILPNWSTPQLAHATTDSNSITCGQEPMATQCAW